MDVPTLTAIVTRYFQEHAACFSLKSERVRTDYVLNWGGFVNHSFTISDGVTVYHLKLTNDASNLQSFHRWERFHRILESRYHAPELITWVDLREISCAGLLFRHVAGQHADFTASPALLKEVIAMTGRLHADRELAEQLKVLEDERSYLDSFVGTYIERFDADLEIIESDLPPFVSQETFRWMQQETRKLEASAHGSPAFALRAQAPIHGDLYENNILVTSESKWFLLDWDDLALGDPALDYALLLWPLLYGQPIRSWRDFVTPLDSDFSPRMELYLRAQLLDQVIDVLADYVESAVAPEQRAFVQAKKREEHLKALACYRQQRTWL